MRCLVDRHQHNEVPWARAKQPKGGLSDRVQWNRNFVLQTTINRFLSGRSIRRTASVSEISRGGSVVQLYGIRLGKTEQNISRGDAGFIASAETADKLYEASQKRPDQSHASQCASLFTFVLAYGPASLSTALRGCLPIHALTCAVLGERLVVDLPPCSEANNPLPWPYA